MGFSLQINLIQSAMIQEIRRDGVLDFLRTWF